MCWGPQRGPGYLSCPLKLWHFHAFSRSSPGWKKLRPQWRLPSLGPDPLPANMQVLDINAAFVLSFLSFTCFLLVARVLGLLCSTQYRQLFVTKHVTRVVSLRCGYLSTPSSVPGTPDVSRQQHYQLQSVLDAATLLGFRNDCSTSDNVAKLEPSALISSGIRLTYKQCCR